jgi:hypothetical protein
VEEYTSKDISNNNNNDLNASSSDKNVAVPISEAEATLHVTRDKITAVFAVAVAVTDIKFTDRPHTINNVIEYADALMAGSLLNLFFQNVCDTPRQAKFF